MDPRIDLIEKKYQKRELPDFRPGDTVKVHVKSKRSWQREDSGI
jgi:large subunit ribosomal protein L19